MGKVCARMFIGVSTHTCINIYIYNVFLKKKSPRLRDPCFVLHGSVGV
jgi:hypothetical protein